MNDLAFENALNALVPPLKAEEMKNKFTQIPEPIEDTIPLNAIRSHVKCEVDHTPVSCAKWSIDDNILTMRFYSTAFKKANLLGASTVQFTFSDQNTQDDLQIICHLQENLGWHVCDDELLTIEVVYKLSSKELTVL